MGAHEHRDDPSRHRCRRSSAKWRLFHDPSLRMRARLAAQATVRVPGWNRWTGRLAFSRAHSTLGGCGLPSTDSLADCFVGRQWQDTRGACIDPTGFDAGKKIKGKKRHLLVDTQGLLLHAIVHSADIQDRDGGVLVMATLFGMYPVPAGALCRRGLPGTTVPDAPCCVSCRQVNVEIVKRSDAAKGFVVLPKRWIVERTIGWLNRCRRLAKDWECLNRSALAFLRWSSIRLMLRKLCQTTK